VFIDAGLIGGTQYVDVLTHPDGDPMQYGLPLDEAVRDYGQHPVITMAQLANQE